MSDPNDEALAGHRLYDSGLGNVDWVGTVSGSAVTAELERRNRVHARHDPKVFDSLVHYIVPLKECVVEVVASSLQTSRATGAARAARFPPSQLTE